jgi:hypothetical protein
MEAVPSLAIPGLEKMETIVNRFAASSGENGSTASGDDQNQQDEKRKFSKEKKRLPLPGGSLVVLYVPLRDTGGAFSHGSLEVDRRVGAGQKKGSESPRVLNPESEPLREIEKPPTFTACIRYLTIQEISEGKYQTLTPWRLVRVGVGGEQLSNFS